MGKYYLRYQTKSKENKYYIAGFNSFEALLNYKASNNIESCDISISENKTDLVEIHEEAYYRAMKRLETEKLCGSALENTNTNIIPEKIISRLSILIPMLMFADNWIPKEGEKKSVDIIKIPLVVGFFLAGMISLSAEVGCILLFGHFLLSLAGNQIYIIPFINIKASRAVVLFIFLYLLLVLHFFQYICLLTCTYISKEKDNSKIYAFAQTIWGFFAFIIAMITLLISLKR